MPDEERKNARRSDAAGGTGAGGGRPRSSGTGGAGRPGGGRQGNDNQGRNTGRQVWQFVAYFVVALIALYLFEQFLLGPMTAPSTELDYGTFKAKVAEGQVLTAVIGENEITGTMMDPSAPSPSPVEFKTTYQAGADERLVADLQAAGVKYSFEGPSSPVGGILISLLPFIFIGVLWYVIVRRMAGGRGGAGGIFGVGKSKATKVEPEQVGVTFKDVGGADEAIEELREIIQFLKTPEQFAKLGGRIPKGVLLVGPPGTGKTLLAKATAGEAGVPFFESSGSEFVEMFVGVGAARVRDLFEQARKAAPAIVFIDEIDAIGQSRGIGIGLGGANDEREQTLNQLLAEIDGFSTDMARPVIIMAATNRPEVLDPALLRAGRFDRQVEVGNPDLIGRIQILKIHSRGIKLARDFDIERAARITPGFSGADLASAMNEAALLAARRRADAVTMKDFEAAMERVIAGLEKKTRVMNEAERRTVAYHESGHALVAALLPHADPVAKISIIPRARGALGYTLQMPSEDRYILTKDELTDRIAVMLGGRAAEVNVLGTVSTGASDDIQKATELARRMITEFGMSEKLGSVRYAGRQLRYLGGVVQDDSHLSPRTQELIDAEVANLIKEQFERARTTLRENRTALETLSQELLAQETVDGSAVQAALEAAKALPVPVREGA
ncbi:MAG: ATP-dependent zinc metalloprotease FtsH [Actinomycetia bacterium]|nr:ATP-dependent zinc metalloprotease FtsH [Actinomycetes bacterium]